jgi:hypothetical protein
MAPSRQSGHDRQAQPSDYVTHGTRAGSVLGEPVGEPSSTHMGGHEA